jgi:hypothetical protein
MGEDLYFSSRPRAFLDNMRPSRAREGLPRTLTTAEVEERLDQHGLLRPDALNELRDEARALAPVLNANAASYVRVMSALQAQSAAGDFSDRGSAELWLRRRDLFRDPGEEQGIDLGMLGVADVPE